MAEAALRYSPRTEPPELVLIHSPEVKTTRTFSLPSREVMVLSALLMLLQIVDGILTGIGVSHLGLSAEGNILLRHMMEQLGYIEALIISKTLAFAIIVTLGLMAYRVNWVSRAMRFLIGLYMLVAVIPWTVIILVKVV